VIALIIKNREVAPKVNDILSSYGDKVVGRLGIPFREKNLSVISVVLEANTDEIGAIAGKLGQLEDVKVKSISV
jgi:putative iron-only hydrogenase system regulator